MGIPPDKLKQYQKGLPGGGGKRPSPKNATKQHQNGGPPGGGGGGPPHGGGGGGDDHDDADEHDPHEADEGDGADNADAEVVESVIEARKAGNKDGQVDALVGDYDPDRDGDPPSWATDQDLWERAKAAVMKYAGEDIEDPWSVTGETYKRLGGELKQHAA